MAKKNCLICNRKIIPLRNSFNCSHCGQRVHIIWETCQGTLCICCFNELKPCLLELSTKEKKRLDKGLYS